MSRDPVEYISDAFANDAANGWVTPEWSGWTGAGWYFWDETWSNCIGPFTTKQEAEDSLARYIR